MIGPVSKSQSPYRKNLKEIARIAQYEPIASIPLPSHDFNYTLVRNRYSDYYENPKVARKSPQKNKEDKLATILETHGRSPLFPKIEKKGINVSQNNLLESPSRKKVRGLRSHFKRDNATTVASGGERSLTIDTRMQTDEDRINQNDNDLSSLLHKDKPNSLGNRTAEREQLHSNGSDLSLMISRKRLEEGQDLTPHRASKIQPKDTMNSSAGIFMEVEEEQSDDDGQFEKDAVPGPGSYNFSYSDFDKTKKTRSTNVSFLSNKTRFRYKEKQEEMQKVENPIKKERQANREQRLKENRPLKKFVPFNSQSPRKFAGDESKKDKSPGPQHYYPRQGMQQTLIRNIQHNFKGNFGANSPRFKYPQQKYPHLAPGYYNSQPQFEDALQNQNFYFKSNKSRF